MASPSPLAAADPDAGPDPARAADDVTGEIPPVPPAVTGHRRRRRALKVILFGLLTVAVLAAGTAVALSLYVRSVVEDIQVVEVFGGVPEEARPPKVVQEAKNLLILGSDSRDPGDVAGSRSDTIILAHIPADRSSAQLISIPRDTWVHVPKSKDGKQGGRDAKINAAFAWGGLPLLVQTVEEFTKVRLDHVVVIDFAGFQQIVDALGGIDVDVDETFKSIHEPFRTFTAGRRHMDGAMALDYARQRKQFADGDFARIRHQQQVIRAVVTKASTSGLLTSPSKLDGFLTATADALQVDETLSVVDLAWQLRGVRGDKLTFLTTPTEGTGRVGNESVVFASSVRGNVLYDAVRADSVDEILAAGK